MKVNVITLCSGYDSQCLALERLKRDFPDFNYELVAWAEFDPESKKPVAQQPAVIAHNALFPQWVDRNVGDITSCDWAKITQSVDLLCYSTPCQSISQSGLQHGFKKDSGTRSSIIWNVLDAINTLKPKFLLMENVPAMVSKKFINDFNEWQKAVASLGYTNYTQLLNARNYGVPQNRNRVFMVSVRNDVGLQYSFPKPFELTLKLKDVLENNVDEKYYLSDKTVESFMAHCDRKQAEGCGFKFEPTDGGGYAKCINTLAGSRQTDNFIKENG